MGEEDAEGLREIFEEREQGRMTDFYRNMLGIGHIGIHRQHYKEAKGLE